MSNNQPELPFNLPDDIVTAVLADTNWYKSKLRPDLSYKLVQHFPVIEISPVLSRELQVGDYFAFINPFEEPECQFYQLIKLDDYECLVYKLTPA